MAGHCRHLINCAVIVLFWTRKGGFLWTPNTDSNIVAKNFTWSQVPVCSAHLLWWSEHCSSDPGIFAHLFEIHWKTNNITASVTFHHSVNMHICLWHKQSDGYQYYGFGNSAKWISVVVTLLVPLQYMALSFLPFASMCGFWSVGEIGLWSPCLCVFLQWVASLPCLLVLCGVVKICVSHIFI